MFEGCNGIQVQVHHPIIQSKAPEVKVKKKDVKAYTFLCLILFRAICFWHAHEKITKIANNVTACFTPSRDAPHSVWYTGRRPRFRASFRLRSSSIALSLTSPKSATAIEKIVIYIRRGRAEKDPFHTGSGIACTNRHKQKKVISGLFSSLPYFRSPIIRERLGMNCCNTELGFCPGGAVLATPHRSSPVCRSACARACVCMSVSV